MTEIRATDSRAHHHAPSTRPEPHMDTRTSLSSRHLTNLLLAAICMLLAIQLVVDHAHALLPSPLLAENTGLRPQSDGPQPVYLVAGPAGGKLDMLPVSVVYLDKNGMLSEAVGPDGAVRVRSAP
jgi:hypothetical protein